MLSLICIPRQRKLSIFEKLKVYCFSSIISPRVNVVGVRLSGEVWPKTLHSTCVQLYPEILEKNVCCVFRLRSPRSVSPQRPTQPSRPHSRNVSPSFADSTFSAVHAALNKRHVQVNCLTHLVLQTKPSLFFVDFVQFIREILDSTSLET